MASPIRPTAATTNPDEGSVRPNARMPGLWQVRAMSNPFRYFNSSPEVIRLVVMMYVRYPLSPRNVEDLLAERGIDINHEIWPNVRRRDLRETRRAYARLSSVALAFG
jgi:hypothetical protein